MADNNKENRMSIDDFDFAHEDANDDTSMLVNYLVTRLHRAMGNPALQGEGETSKRGLSTEKGVENPYQELKQLLEGKPSSKKKGHAQHERSPSREREESDSSDESLEDVAPRKRRAQRSPTPTKRKRSPHSPHRRESKREEKNSKKKKERKRSPSSPSSSPSSSSDEGSKYYSQERQRRGHRRSYAAWKRSSKLKKFKEGGKNISFLTYDGTFGATNKVLAFIQQFDAAFGDEGFMESSKIHHVAMHFQKSARQWWASLRANGEAPKTWKALRASIMKQFLASNAKDKVLTVWRSLKLSPYESIHKYVNKFWDLHLKSTVYKKIDFEEQKQQFFTTLPEDMNKYVNSQRPRSISANIHHTMVAARINFQQGAMRNLKPMEAKEKQEYKGKNFSQNSSKGNSNNNKAKEKGLFKGKNKLNPKELERYRKENKCFKCGEQGHSYRSCYQRNPRNEQLRASMVEAPKEEVHCKGSPLSYAWGKVKKHDAFILFDPGSTHNFISLELATKLGVQDFEMGDAMKADGAFINQEVSVTPWIGKLRLHIQGYVDKEDFFISPLKHEDVILGAPWFDHLAASIKFPERKISFKLKEKDMYINAQELGSSIPLVIDQVFDKSIKRGYLLHGNRLCITRSLHEKVMFESHAPPYAGHRGIQTTMKAIETYFYWPTMKGDIQAYVSKCVVCQKTKYDRGKQPSLLQPLPIRDSPWESISMDFIFGLPKSIHGNTGIWTIVDRFSKQAHFIPVKKTIKAHQMATLFISQVFKYHGLPTSIVSDRDPRMTSNFWKGLFENLGTRLNFSSAYHPQTDGQSEIANLTFVDLLKAYVTKVDQRSQWEKYLPLVEYVYNDTVHTSTRKAPFEVIEGRSKSPLLLKVHGKIFAADEYSRVIKESFQKIKEAISIAQQKQKAAANKHRRALAFKENDWVLLKFRKARQRHTTGKNPREIKSTMRNWQKGEPPKEAIMEDPPEVEGQEEVLQPESVLQHEDNVLRNGKIIRWYIIKFKNYPFEDAKWMQGTHLKDSLHLVNAYNDSLE
ncbi:hypothetical protein L7F22_020211 [Adiantum nelumboides]|nr:hypothetical protein [Adiantum nelumboides]